MKDEHILGLIENSSFAGLSEKELADINAHAKYCADCLRAVQAAQLSQILLKEHAAVEFQPSPFFHTRVLATLRERQAANDSWALGRLWRAAGALASSMAVTVATLAFLTFVIPDTQVVSQVSPSANGYSAEEVILDQGPQSEEVSEGQVLTTLYDGDE